MSTASTKARLKRLESKLSGMQVDSKKQDYKRLKRLPKHVETKASKRKLLEFVARIRFSAASPQDSYTFRGNGLYDPDETGVGVQPEGFDEMMALYDNYRVHGSKIIVDFINESSSTFASTKAVAVYASRDNAPAPASSVEVAQRHSGHRLLGLGTSGIPKVRITRSSLTGKSYATPDIRTGDMFSGTASANPSNEWYWNVVSSSIDDASTHTSYPVTMLVRIVYDVEFHNPKELAMS